MRSVVQIRRWTRCESRVNKLQHEKSDLKKQHESHIADEELAASERDTVMADLRSLLDHRNHQLNDMERSMGTIEEDRTRIQLDSTEVQVTIVSLRRELDEARAGTLTARASEEAARLQITYDGRAAGAEPDNRYSPASSGVKRHFSAASPGTSTCKSRAAGKDTTA